MRRMEHGRNHAAKEDVETKLSIMEYASGMGQRANCVAVLGAKIELERGEFVRSMGQRSK